MTDRWKHQPAEVSHALDPARALFWSPRTGKTRTIVECIKAQTTAGAQRIVVIAPQFVCRTVWSEELACSGFGVCTYDLSAGKITQRIEMLKYLRGDGKNRTAVVLVNWESLGTLVEDLLKWKPDVVIADEAHYAKSASAARSRALHRLGRVAKYRRALTGTPTPRDYIDLYSQYKFLAPHIFGTNKGKFVENYVELDFFKRPKYYKNLPELRAKMLSIASVFDRAVEWKDLPPLEIRHRVDLPSKARQIYDKIVTEAVAEFDEVEIDATHKLSRIMKLQQLTAGFLKDDDGEVHWIHNAKTDAVVEQLRDLLAAGSKAVVFYHFSEEGKEIERRVREEYGALVGRIGGDTPLGVRERLQKSFLSTGVEALRVMVMQNSLGIGISLRSAPYLIRTSYPLDYATFVQSNERIYDDPSTPRTFISIEATRTVDDFARRICTKKEQAARALVTEGFANVAYGKLNLEMAA